MRWVRATEFRGVQTLAPTRVQAQPFAGNLEALREQFRELPFSLHAAAESRVVVAPAAHVADARHDVFRLQRIVPLQPVFEKILHLPGKAQQRVSGHACPGLAHGLENRFHVLVVRSEEHTSELQSQSNLVCRLLLEKKKKIKIT